jgi:uncharacterized protein (DUF4415 family)
MTTGIEELKLPKERKGRGLGKRPRMTCTSLRLPVDVIEYFEQYHEYSKQAKMREVLIDYVKQHTGVKNV